jgi:hypothetical protein
VAVRATGIAGDDTVTVAPGMTPPSLSITRPAIDPRPGLWRRWLDDGHGHRRRNDRRLSYGRGGLLGSIDIRGHAADAAAHGDEQDGQNDSHGDSS